MGDIIEVLVYTRRHYLQREWQPSACFGLCLRVQCLLFLFRVLIEMHLRQFTAQWVF